MALAVGDILSVQLRGFLFAQRILNVLHYRVAAAVAGGTDAQVLHLANVIGAGLGGNLFKTRLLAATAVDYSLASVRAQRVWPTRTAYQDYVVGENGTIDVKCSSANIAASLQKRTGTPGRKGVGKFQLAGIVDNVMDNGELNVDYRTDQLGDLSTEINGEVVGTTYLISWLPVLFHPSEGADPYSLLTNVIPQSSVRTMHRRTLRVGE